MGLSPQAAETTRLIAPLKENAELHPVLRERRSGYAFSTRAVDEEALRLLFEAARWAPSSYNDQPWRFIVARRGTAAFERMLGALMEGNRVWARRAPVLILAVAKLSLDFNGRPNRHAFYDLGQAVAHLSFQATALGLSVHQMGGFSVEEARRAFGIPEGYEPATVIALGFRGEAEDLPEPLRNRESAPRRRKPIESIVFDEAWREAPKATS